MKNILIVLLTLFITFKASAKDSFAIIGDAGFWNNKAKKVRDSILKTNIRKLILPGDNLYDEVDSYDSVWRNWSNKGFTFDVVAIGNHTKGYQQEMKYFNMPAQNYTKVVGKTRFIVLNSDNEYGISQVRTWLIRVLENSDDKNIFIVLHHPPVSVSYRHGWKEKESFHTAIFPVIEKFREKITALIAGHDHIASMHTIDDLPLIVSGAVFEVKPTVPLNYVSESRGFFVQTRWLFERDPYWVRLDVKKNGDTWVNYINALKNTIDCTALIVGSRMLLQSNCAESTMALEYFSISE